MDLNRSHAARLVRRVVWSVLAAVIAASAALCLVVVDTLGELSGPATWALLAVFVVCGAGLSLQILTLVLRESSYIAARRVLVRVVLAGVTVLSTLAVLDGALLVLAHLSHRPAHYVLPPEWELKDLPAFGVHRAWLWHGQVHVAWTQEWQFRRAEEFSPRRPGVCRIVVVGDSLTFGVGVAHDATYPSVLERALSSDHPVEVLNLGVRGAQSEEVAETLEHWLPRLAPDLVVYGICLNDLLECADGEPAADVSYALPLPKTIESFFATRSLGVSLLADLYNRSLITLGLRVSFCGQLETDSDVLFPRFRRDLIRMSSLVRDAGLPPVVATVLDQAPREGGCGQGIALKMEASASEAGMTVVPSAGYYHEHDGDNFMVSRWEGHPNEEAHHLFAGRLASAIERSGLLDRCTSAPGSGQPEAFP